MIYFVGVPKKTVISNTEELYQAIADALDSITSDDALNSINHCLMYFIQPGIAISRTAGQKSRQL
jgi:hypothetical protein